MTAALRDWATGPSRTNSRRPAGQTDGRKPELRVLDQAAIRRRRRLRGALAALFVAVLFGFFAVAFVHAQLVAGQQDLDEVRTLMRETEVRKAELVRAVELASAPNVIMDRATEDLGMVPAETPVYLAAAAPVRAVPDPTPLGTVVGGSGEGTSSPVASSESVNSDGETIRIRAAVGDPGGVQGAVVVENAEPIAAESAQAIVAEPTQTVAADETVIPASLSSTAPVGTASSFAGIEANTGGSAQG